MEYAYFEGQRDAITGRIRIQFDTAAGSNGKDSCWYWTESPWDNSKRTIVYDPTSVKKRKD